LKKKLARPFFYEISLLLTLTLESVSDHLLVWWVRWSSFLGNGLRGGLGSRHFLKIYGFRIIRKNLLVTFKQKAGMNMESSARA